MRNGAQVVVRRERQDLKRDVEKRVRKPAHPFIWSLNPEYQKAARQWWFKQISLGKIRGGSGRYVRTGRIIRAWKIITNLDNFEGLITLQNNAPGAEFVVGMKQVPSHARSGHPRIDKLAMASSKRMSPKLTALWRTVSRPQVA